MTSEADTRANYIDPALASTGWQSSQIVREYYFTDGRKLAGGQRGTRCFVDYLLHSSNRHLATLRRMFAAEQCLLAFLTFEQPMETRRVRAEATRENAAFFDQFEQPPARDFLHFVLNRYEETGVSELARDRMPGLIELSGLGTTRDASRAFGGSPAQVLTAFRQLQQELYRQHARV